MCNCIHELLNVFEDSAQREHTIERYSDRFFFWHRIHSSRLIALGAAQGAVSRTSSCREMCFSTWSITIHHLESSPQKLHAYYVLPLHLLSLVMDLSLQILQFLLYYANNTAKIVFQYYLF